MIGTLVATTWIGIASQMGGQSMSPIKAGAPIPEPLGIHSFGVVEPGQYDYKAVRAALDEIRANDQSISSFLGNKALILYDWDAGTGFAPEIYAQHLRNLLNHFGVAATAMKVSDYQAGMINSNVATFYFGYLYDFPLPAAFKADVLAAKKPVVWMGFNLWQVAWTPDESDHNPSFYKKYGFKFLQLNESGYPTVRYKKTLLERAQWSKIQGQCSISDGTIASVPATSVNSAGATIPYVVRGGNLWYFSDIPLADLSYVTMRDRTLVFDDLLHDILGRTTPEVHKAFVRIEDIHPLVPPSKVRKIADTLAAQGVPFGLLIIPEYRDPVPTFHPSPFTVKLTDKPDLIAAIQYAQSKGGQVIMHGYTHQYSTIPNPYDGVSADDFEFFRVILDANNRQVLVGPVPEDSTAWVKGRIKQGKAILSAAGFTNVPGWVTPHYIASPEDYRQFHYAFQFSLCRGLYFATGANGKLYYLQQTAAYPFVDTFGMKRLPENAGYMDPVGFEEQPPTMPSDIKARAHANKVVRDGWTGFYFHWFLEASLLRQAVTAVKNEGFTFVNPSVNEN